MSQLKQKPDDYINVTIELDDMDITSAETKAIYDEIKKYMAKHNAGTKVSNLYISQVKRKCGIDGSLTVVSNFSLTKSLKTLIISMLLSFFIVKFAKINVLIWANVCYNRHRR